VKEVDDILQHYGVMGMRWGVRKRSSLASGPTQIKLNARPGQKIITSGGHRQPASEDAKLAAAIRQKARSSGPQSLSNSDMRKLVDRMNLEQQYAKLNPKQKSLGEKFIKDYAPILGLEGVKAVQAKKYAEALALDPKAVKDPRLQMAIQIGEALTKATKKK